MTEAESQPKKIINWIQVPELEVMHCAEELLKETTDDPDLNMFQKVLNAGAIFKEAGLRPMYLIQPNFKDIMVTPAEYVMRTVTIH